MRTRATQERTLGAILGMGIGDALGMGVAGLDAAEITSSIGPVDRYIARRFPDGSTLAAGEFTDETEIALCIMETYTSTAGRLDLELIRARMQFLAAGEAKRWMSAGTRRSLDDDADDWYRSPVDDDPSVLLRGVPIGIIHATSELDIEQIEADVRCVVGLTHSSPVLTDLTTAVAVAIARVLAGTTNRATIARDISPFAHLSGVAGSAEQGHEPPPGDSSAVLTSAILAYAAAERFEDAVVDAVSAGGASDSRGALAGALAGAEFGAGGIPQSLIDGLEGRIYLTLAAPWFYRTVQLMTGRGISIERQGT